MATDLHTYDLSPQHLSYADRIAAQWQDFVILLARVLIGLIYLISGWSKITNLDGFIASLERRGLPGATLLGYAGAATEFFGGLAIMLGFATRYAALFILLFTIVATLISHRYWDMTDAALRRQNQTHFFKNLTMMGGILLLFLTGGGRFSLDHLFRRRRPG